MNEKTPENKDTQSELENARKFLMERGLHFFFEGMNELANLIADPSLGNMSTKMLRALLREVKVKFRSAEGYFFDAAYREASYIIRKFD